MIFKEKETCSSLGDWVRLAPFMSHAWIEIENVPIKEAEDLSKLRKIVVI
jgi:hypothetical protein